MKTKKGSVKETTKSEKGKYTLSVLVNDSEYKGKGKDMVEALAGFVSSPLFPFGVKTRVVLSFSDGKREGVYRYPVKMARRVFKMMAHKTSALEILARKMEERLS